MFLPWPFACKAKPLSWGLLFNQVISNFGRSMIWWAMHGSVPCRPLFFFNAGVQAKKITGTIFRVFSFLKKLFGQILVPYLPRLFQMVSGILRILYVAELFLFTAKLFSLHHSSKALCKISSASLISRMKLSHVHQGKVRTEWSPSILDTRFSVVRPKWIQVNPSEPKDNPSEPEWTQVDPK